ncbi:PREDICTED: uncharacterized protein LOC109221243, partial [Nicotiana attenuata]|uniref:uncharacterized protein LOC109221243 n=1 Tax=Nicotiana attenuata TaxID=49451 RepID=UPI0009050813
METNVLFGEKVIVFGGDFRQTLPVIQSGQKEDFIREKNMRAKTDPSFCEYLMRIGNGTEKTSLDDKIEIPRSFIVPYITEKESLISLFPEDAKTFVAADETVEPNDQSQFEDFLYSLNLAGLPPYKLILKENCPVMLLRNLNPCEALCNGTRLICCDFKTRVISAKIAT